MMKHKWNKKAEIRKEAEIIIVEFYKAESKKRKIEIKSKKKNDFVLE